MKRILPVRQNIIQCCLQRVQNVVQILQSACLAQLNPVKIVDIPNAPKLQQYLQLQDTPPLEIHAVYRNSLNIAICTVPISATCYLFKIFSSVVSFLSLKRNHLLLIWLLFMSLHLFCRCKCSDQDSQICFTTLIISNLINLYKNIILSSK